MTIYTNLLAQALARPPDPGPGTEASDTSVVLERCRDRLPVAASDPPGLDTLADALAYDVALVRHAEHLGIRRDLRPFEHPIGGRQALERLVRDRESDRSHEDGAGLRSP